MGISPKGGIAPFKFPTLTPFRYDFDVSVMLVRGVIRTNRGGKYVRTLKSHGDMKQGSNNRRSRSRSGGGKRQSGGGRNNFESNGPDVKIRGTAQQVQEKYLSLARDATSSGDWVSAEAYFQFAEHYHRVISANASNAAAKNQGQNQGQNQNKGQGDSNARNQASQNPDTQEIKVPQTDSKAETKDESKPSPEAAAKDEAEVIDTSPAALAAAVAEREDAGTAKAPEAKAESVPEKAAS